MGMTNGINSLERARKQAEILVSTLKGKNVTIIGHDNIDVDSALSGILLSKLLDFLNINNKFYILEEVKEDETYNIIKDLIEIDLKNWQGEDKEDRNLFLVDHYKTTHEGNVIGIIDHHPTKQENKYDFTYVRNSCATAYIIYEMMEAVNFPIGKEEAKMIIVAMMVDTISFRSSKTIKEEVQRAKILAETYGLDYEYLEKQGLCLTPIDKLNIQQIISNGQKWYNYSHKKIGSMYLQLYGMPKKEQIEEWINALKIKLNETCSDMLVLVIFETKSNKTYEYQIMSDCIKETVSIGILSRGKNIMPVIESRYLKQKNIEEKMHEIVKDLIEQNMTIATMESCTGGGLANQITNISGASNVLKESYVSYCNEAKIKFGVPKEVIEKYTVYSAETAIAMANAVKKEANASIGIGITGQIGRIDPNNPGCENGNVWYAISNNSDVAVCKLYVDDMTRDKQKKIVIREITETLRNIIDFSKNSYN